MRLFASASCVKAKNSTINPITIMTPKTSVAAEKPYRRPVAISPAIAATAIAYLIAGVCLSAWLSSRRTQFRKRGFSPFALPQTSPARASTDWSIDLVFDKPNQVIVTIVISGDRSLADVIDLCRRGRLME